MHSQSMKKSHPLSDLFVMAPGRIIQPIPTPHPQGSLASLVSFKFASGECVDPFSVQVLL
jgi:hypothetical protein